ncbi:MAG: hypothetical protein JXA13_00835 [Anaerolineales bacterium]|nr:hypothetical protein [Anaerolineales bacterium]
MTIPALLLGFLVSTLLGVIFHLIVNGGIGRMALYILFSWIGFWIGHLTNWMFGWAFFVLGSLNLGMAVLGSIIIMLVGYWLSLVEITSEDESDDE